MTEQKRQAPHLLSEPPILVYPTLAEALGINHAIVFQQLHFLLNGQKASKNEYNFVDDTWWVYNSYAEWRKEYFCWLSVSSLKGIFLQLEKLGLVISRQSVKNKSDRRKWYTIDYKAWDKFCLTIGQNLSHEPSDKKYPIIGQEIADGYSETTTETTKTTTENNTPIPPRDAFADFVETLPVDETPEPSKPVDEDQAARQLISTYLTETKSADMGMIDHPKRNQEALKLFDFGMTPAHIKLYLKRMKAEDDFWKGYIPWAVLIKKIVAHFDERPLATTVFVPEEPIEPVAPANFDPDAPDVDLSALFDMAVKARTV